ncbi:MAG TPA: cytochrome c oxidase assembly protein [Ktedonobacterales bacterium]|nr:cytochrome c oxidase assembly protein [Ktedonobacterales bacterium]
MPRAVALGWNWDPAVLLGLTALCAAYYAAVVPRRGRAQPGAPATRRQVAMFSAGVAVLALTLITPLDTLGRTALFSAHMVQLMLLNTLVAPLLLLGLPEALAQRALRPLGRLARPGEGGTLLLWVAAALLFNGVFLLWHVGRLYAAGLGNPALHDLEGLTILLSGVVRWWPLLTPAEGQTRLANPGQILYILLESLPIDIFAVALIFARGPLYAIYAHAPRVWGIPPMLDQQIAACVALIPGTFLDFILISVIFFAWFQRMERDQQVEDERLAALQ